jgi:methionyl-tRNA formyltransferase
MRIVLNGQQAFGQAVLEALIDRGDDVVAVYCEPGDNPSRPDPLHQSAQDRGIQVLQPKNFKGEQVLSEFKSLKPDLGVMAYVTRIVPASFLNAPLHGTIQYHPSLLPAHRGPSSMNWPIIQGEEETGLTIFWPDEGLDTGPILMQKKVTIESGDTLGSLYFNKLYPLGVEALLESIDLVKKGNAPRVAQDESEASYESWCNDDAAMIDWTQSTIHIYNLIRGCNPQPGAWTDHQGGIVRFYDVNIAAMNGEPGSIIATTGDGVVFATVDGAIEVLRLRENDGPKIRAGESSLGVGTHFGPG